MILNTLDLFAGIGGFSLGLERTGGFRTAAFCEIDPVARKVLAKNFPNIPIYEDVTALTKEQLDADGLSIDVITGGFPCQDISLAGRGGGLEGSRSSLWFQYLRLIQEIRPRFAIIENSPALRGRGLGTVLRGLDAIRYDAEWHCIPASATGAPHRRDRIWVIAYPRGDALADAGSGRSSGPCGWQVEQPGRTEAISSGETVADAYCPRLEIMLPREAPELSPLIGARPWGAEPDVGRVAYGVPGRVDRIKQLGNAVVPPIPELIGRAILQALSGR